MKKNNFFIALFIVAIVAASFLNLIIINLKKKFGSLIFMMIFIHLIQITGKIKEFGSIMNPSVMFLMGIMVPERLVTER